MRLRRTALAAALALALAAARARASQLADRLFLNFLPPNKAALAITPPSIRFADTPIVIRYTLIGAAAIYDAQALCQPAALSFLGVRDSAPPALCERDSNAELVSLTAHRALSREFPDEARSYADFLRGEKLQIKPAERDRNTANGLANFLGDRLADFFAADGWNSLGDLAGPTRPTPHFADVTGYTPVNVPGLPPDRLSQPLRWQPFIRPGGHPGAFLAQVHVVPHIGRTVAPLVLSPPDLAQRTARDVFRSPNRKGSVSAADARKARALLREVVTASARLTDEQIFLAHWWDNKLLSTAAISAFYERAARLTPFQIAQQFLGEMAAQHDALIATWREKRRFDQARPRTVLRRLQPGAKFRAYVRGRDVGERGTFEDVTSETWQPLVDEQPHSEFPSASAALCTAAMESIQTFVESKLGGGKVPTIKIRFAPDASGEPPFPFLWQDRTVAFADPAAAALSCGESRLWAGVHFRPAIEEGLRLGRGVGKAAVEHFRLLGEGRVPPDCARCIKGGAPEADDKDDDR